MSCVETLKLLISFVVIAVAVYCIWKSHLESIKQVEIIERPIQRSAQRRILLWNALNGDRRWGAPEDKNSVDYFRDVLKCPVFNCSLEVGGPETSNVDNYEAVVFNGVERFDQPMRRNPQQLYVFAAQSPPPTVTRERLYNGKFFYNLTMSYRLDSDILWSYFQFVDKASGLVVAPRRFIRWRTPSESYVDSELQVLYGKKAHKAFWFPNQCAPKSHGKNLVSKLATLNFDIHIYGACGNLSCSWKTRHCSHMLNSTYLFYFAFEDVLCTDYLSADVARAMQHAVIPVVMGSAEYAQFLPPHSYIDAESFASASDLKNHLQHIAQDETKYMSYFWWREYYKIEPAASPFCKLCEYLNTELAMRSLRSEQYPNMEEWWLRDSCRSRNQFDD